MANPARETPSYSPQFFEALRQRDPVAFTKFYQDHIGILERFYTKRRLPQQEIEEFTQRTFTRAWEMIENYVPHPDSPPANWLITLGLNKLRDEKRRLYNKIDEVPLGIPDDLSEESSQPQIKDPTAEDPFDRVEELMDFAPLAHRLQAGLKTLKETPRRILELEFVGGLEVAQIPEQVGQSYANVKTLKHRALERLRLFIDPNSKRPKSRPDPPKKRPKKTI